MNIFSYFYGGGAAGKSRTEFHSKGYPGHDKFCCTHCIKTYGIERIEKNIYILT